MFIGDYEQTAVWSEQGLNGCLRFLNRIEKLAEKLDKNAEISNKLTTILHKTIKKVTNDIDNFKFNTAVSALMIFLNALEKEGKVNTDVYRTLLLLLNPIYPHLTEELNSKYCSDVALANSQWATYDDKYLIDNEIEIGVQVNGKLRGTITISVGEEEDSVKEKAMSLETVQAQLNGNSPRKVIVVKNKIVNVVA